MSRTCKLAARVGALMAAALGAVLALNMGTHSAPTTGQVPASLHSEYGNRMVCQWEGESAPGMPVRMGWVCQ